MAYSLSGVIFAVSETCTASNALKQVGSLSTVFSSIVDNEELAQRSGDGGDGGARNRVA